MVEILIVSLTISIGGTIALAAYCVELIRERRSYKSRADHYFEVADRYWDQVVRLRGLLERSERMNSVCISGYCRARKRADALEETLDEVLAKNGHAWVTRGPEMKILIKRAGEEARARPSRRRSKAKKES